MARYVAARLAWLAVVLLAVSAVTFALGVQAPGDPAVMAFERSRPGQSMVIASSRTLLDAAGRVEYTSPNGVSALHRIGVHANTEGLRFGELGLEPLGQADHVQDEEQLLLVDVELPRAGGHPALGDDGLELVEGVLAGPPGTGHGYAHFASSGSFASKGAVGSKDGAVMRLGGGPSVQYAQLVGGQHFEMKVEDKVALKPPATYTMLPGPTPAV